MATIRSTGAALLGTVSVTANAVIRTVNMVDGLVQYGDNWVRHTLDEQRKSIALDSAVQDERMVTAAARAQAERDLETEMFLNLSPDHRTLYNANLDRFRTALATAKA